MSKWSWYVNKKGEVVNEGDEEVPWENRGETAGADYGNSNSGVCEHVWVNVGFHHITMACKHCGVDPPSWMKFGD